ncbi:MAG TPA: HD domain-containing protein, partial [Luteibaculaceae bacterium]|nr:HD domain-containing protein [Luteibaculaceae bacterium]
MSSETGKRKIINDPVHGFIALPSKVIVDMVEHPFFQRLRRIKQLGLTHMVYPGALHTRFHHVLGAMHLMNEALDVLSAKGEIITPEEKQGALLAILLHDIGHGPFSHALENTLVTGVHHEQLSELFMDLLNKEFNGALSLGISIFKNQYPKKFLHQLVSSQLDMDRLDYLSRDSFYTGVSEGVISAERIIKMLAVVNDELVVEEKGVYSIEKFIVARRLMYWQVYLHKTVVSAEFLLVNILKRAKELAKRGEVLFASPALQRFLYHDYEWRHFEQDPTLLTDFAQLDDFDIMTSVKVWQSNSDKVLAELCHRMVNRQLFKIVIQKEPFQENKLIQLKS